MNNLDNISFVEVTVKGIKKKLPRKLSFSGDLEFKLDIYNHLFFLRYFFLDTKILNDIWVLGEFRNYFKVTWEIIPDGQRNISEEFRISHIELKGNIYNSKSL